MVDRGARTAALVLNWRRADLTLRCVADLLAVPSPPMLVVVLDNGSGAEVVAALRAGLDALLAQLGQLSDKSLAPHQGPQLLQCRDLRPRSRVLNPK